MIKEKQNKMPVVLQWLSESQQKDRSLKYYKCGKHGFHMHIVGRLESREDTQWKNTP